MSSGCGWIFLWRVYGDGWQTPLGGEGAKAIHTGPKRSFQV